MPMPREDLCAVIAQAIETIETLPIGEEPLGAFIVIPCQGGRIVHLLTHQPKSHTERWAVVGSAHMALQGNSETLPVSSSTDSSKAS